MITVVIPHLPDRAAMLDRALASVAAQTLRPYSVIVQPDHQREGEHITRNKALADVNTSLVAFLDDDDEMLPHHLETLYDALMPTRTALAWSRYQTIGADYTASFIEGSYLAYTEALREIGGFPEPNEYRWADRYPDYGLLCRLIMAGLSFTRVNQVTWRKYIHDTNIVGTGT